MLQFMGAPPQQRLRKALRPRPDMRIDTLGPAAAGHGRADANPWSREPGTNAGTKGLGT